MKDYLQYGEFHDLFMQIADKIEEEHGLKEAKNKIPMERITDMAWESYMQYMVRTLDKSQSNKP